jgi:CubicO group peptidase (beta-lactamase class C family)
MKRTGLLSHNGKLAWKNLISFLLALLVFGCTPSGSPTPEPPAWVEDFFHNLEELASTNQFSGAALVAWQENVFLEKAFGLADRDREISIGMDTQFNLGSMNKMFSAVAIM